MSVIFLNLVAVYEKNEIKKGNIKHDHNVNGFWTPTYMSWANMKQRCLNVNSINFKYYGGRGIKIYIPWLDFKKFLADLGERPQNKTLDRYPNNDGNYEPGNVRWATWSEQMKNRKDY